MGCLAIEIVETIGFPLQGAIAARQFKDFKSAGMCYEADPEEDAQKATHRGKELGHACEGLRSHVCVSLAIRQGDTSLPLGTNVSPMGNLRFWRIVMPLDLRRVRLNF